MNEHKLHIIAFDNPFPPYYGGAIDVFYRIQALAQIGVKITLHCYYKGELHRAKELESLCEKVYYYPRNTSWTQQLHILPYGVQSRKHKDMLQHLLADDAPILFEGLVSCALLAHPALRNRRKYFRECNVEHDYYHALGKASPALWKKLFFHIEAERLRLFERHLSKAQGIFSLAHQDEEYFKKNYPTVPTIYAPCFHGHSQMLHPTNTDRPYILYHGNLAVAENHKAALFILRHIAPFLPYPVIIAGNNPSEALQQEAKRCENVSIISNPDAKAMQTLIGNARIHLLITFQNTGIKLKLLNVLFTEGHVVVNPAMTEGTELNPLCHVGANAEELIQWCKTLFDQKLSKAETDQRMQHLNASYNDISTAQKMVKIIFEQ